MIKAISILGDILSFYSWEVNNWLLPFPTAPAFFPATPSLDEEKQRCIFWGSNLRRPPPPLQRDNKIEPRNQNLDITAHCRARQAFTNCVNVHANGVTRARTSVQDIDWQHNWELLIAYPHRPLCFKKIRTITIAFLIFNTVVTNPYSHSTAFDLQSFVPLHPCLKFQVRLIDLSQSDSQIPFVLQTDNNTQQCVNGWSGIFQNKFVAHGQYIRFATALIISIYQKW